MAAGPGIAPRAPGSPRLAGRSARNYPHLVAERMGYTLHDVTYSGATTANLLTEAQNGAPPQLTALDGSEDLVTVTVGGNDVGYVPYLMAAALPRVLRALPVIGRSIRDLLEDRPGTGDDGTDNPDNYLRAVRDSLYEVARTIREAAPAATVIFVDYLTLLPPPGEPASPLTPEHADVGRGIGAALAAVTADVANVTGCRLVRASEASQDHHAWSAVPWTTRPGLPLPWGTAPLHPNAAGMRAVADLVVAALSDVPSGEQGRHLPY
jgi:lysophospholipase L1-like esterase